MMKTKKGQTEIIVTVLLVLIALAAVTAIAYFITGQVKNGTALADNKANCLKLDFQVTKAISGTSNVIVQRNDDGTVILQELKVLVDGVTANGNATVPTSLETTVIPVTNSTDGTSMNLTTGQKIEIGAVLTNGGTCADIASATVTSA